MSLSVIGAGFGRTGTMSLKLALEQLGFGPCYHMVEVFKGGPDAFGWWEDAADGRPDWPRIFAGYYSTVDWPSATFYAELAEAYPDAKVILTRRDPESWFRSTQATIFAQDITNPENPFERMVTKVVGRLFDLRMHDKARLLEVYERHNAEVQRRIPADRLLVYELSEGWAPLCAFLGVPVPETPMPKVNTTEEFWTSRGLPVPEPATPS
ncbi:MAG: hypothetical protein JO111_17485 [Caulobacteraceae bacterium]|nr:hypothetical protein [Caulobacteraceae bacterium]